MNIYTDASAGEATLLTSLMRRAKAHWGYPNEWMQEWQEELTLSQDYIESNIVVKLESEGELIGFYGLELQNDIAYLGHLWLEPSKIGHGFGKTLFKKVCEDAINQGYSAMEFVADPNAEGFYRHQGVVKIGELRGSIFGTPRVLPKMRIEFNK